MKNIIAVAALVVAGFAAPTVSVQAASSYPTKCLVLPLLQSECREIITENVSSAAGATAMVASTTVSTAKSVKWPAPAWWTCTRAEDAKYLLACE